MTTMIVLLCILILSNMWLFLVARGYLLDVTQRHLEITNLVARDHDVVAKNQVILNNIEMGLFSAKEHGLFLYDHYAAMMELLGNLYQDNSWEHLNKASTITHKAMQSVVDDFYSTFGMTPEQWRSQRIYTKTLNPKTGKVDNSSFSIN